MANSEYADYILAFQRWCELDGKGASGPKYVNYLSCFNKEIGEPTHSTWNGLYRIAYNTVAEKEVVEIDNLRDFRRIYGAFLEIATDDIQPDGIDAEVYHKIKDWFESPEVKGPSCLSAALKAYQDFLIWKACQTEWMQKFRTWLSLPERNNGKGYKLKTQERYFESLPRLDCVIWKWNIHLPPTCIPEVKSAVEFDKLCEEIRSQEDFHFYNDNIRADGSPHNYNGTGNGDPSAALLRYSDFLHECGEPIDNTEEVLSLDNVLRLFLENRDDAEWVAKLAAACYPGLDARFAAWNPSMSEAEFDAWLVKDVWCARKDDGTLLFNGKNLKEKSAAEKVLICKEIAQWKNAPGSASDYFEGTLPNGIGTAFASEMLCKFHPRDYCIVNRLMMQGLDVLGLADIKSWPNPVRTADYQRMFNLQSQIKEKMSAMKVRRRQDVADNNHPDFITVNEFLWWCHDNEKLLKEKMMSEKMKNANPTKFAGERKKLNFVPGNEDDKLLLRLLASLRAKHFAILAGHSGTGKSRYVKKLAYMTCNVDELRIKDKLPGNYLLLQVKPNWHDSTDLLGFRNAMDNNRYQKTSLIEFLFRAYHFSETPFFLCLDEMNLAPVEQYFAEFLSTMESEEPVPLNDISADDDNLFELGCEWTDSREYIRNKGFSIPKNLFIVGTVNMDETTNQFSRKVLDRAFTIEMTDVDFTRYGAVTKPGYDDIIEEDKIKALLKGPFSAEKLDDEDKDKDSPLNKVQHALAPTAFAIAYRFASEYTLLKQALAVFDPDNTMKLDALDQAVLMKVLPRIAGETDYIRKLYGESESEGLRNALTGKTASLTKIKAILDRAKESDAQYITFWP